MYELVSDAFSFCVEMSIITDGGGDIEGAYFGDYLIVSRGVSFQVLFCNYQCGVISLDWSSFL